MVGTLILLLFFSIQPNAGLASQIPTRSNNLESKITEAERLRKEGEFEKAAKVLLECKTQAAMGGDIETELRVSQTLAILYWNLGDHDASFKELSEAFRRAIIKNAPTLEKEIGVKIDIFNLYNIGRQYLGKEEYEKSIESFAEAISLAQKFHIPEFEAKCLRQQSNAYYFRSQFEKFYELNQKADKIAADLKNIREQGICQNNLGLYFYEKNNFTQALRYYERGLELSSKANNSQSISEIINNLGLIYKEFGNFEEALSLLNRSLEIDKNDANTSYVILDLLNLGATYRKRGLTFGNKADFLKALDYFFECRRLQSSMSERRMIPRIYNNIGTVYTDLEDYNLALESFFSALKETAAYEDIGDRSAILNNIGKTYNLLGNYAEGSNYCLQAILLADQLKSQQVLWEARLDLADSYHKQKEYEKAFESYRESVAIIEEIRGSIESTEHKSGYLGSGRRIDVYNKIIELLIEWKALGSDSDKEEAFGYLERGRARSFLDSLENADLKVAENVNPSLIEKERAIASRMTAANKKLMSNRLTELEKAALNSEAKAAENELENLKKEIRRSNPAYASSRYPEIITLAELQSKYLDSRTLAVAYSIGKERSIGFSISKNGMTSFFLPGRNELREKIREYLRKISNRESRDFSLGHELYGILIGPAIQGNYKKILIVPDDILNYLPFSTLLTTSDPGSWLIRDYSIGYIPSFSSYKEILVMAQKRPSRKFDWLAFGAPKFEESEALKMSLKNLRELYPTSTIDTPSLFYSNQEIESISHLFNRKKIQAFSGDQATEDRFDRLPVESFKIIHFSAHGLIHDQNPMRSAIVLSLINETREDGLVQVREIYDRKINADLVVLSACQSALGQFIKGEGIIGLNRAFLFAGASAVLMTQWSINDQASSYLMERFYRRLKKSESIAAALQKAQLDLMTDPAYAHPFFWAGYVISGDTERIIFPRKIPIIVLLGILCAGGILVGILIWKKRRSARLGIR